MQSSKKSAPTEEMRESHRLAARLGRLAGWSDRVALVVLSVLMVLGAALVVRKHSPGRTVVAGTAWTEALACAFVDGWCPAGWGWGEWEIAAGLLRGRALAGQDAVYFFCQRAALEPASHLQAPAARPRPSGPIGNSEQPCAPFAHSGEFLLETRVRLRAGFGVEGPEAQLLIRDGSEAREGAGVTLGAGRESIRVRYRTNGREHVYRTIPLGRRTELDRWYRVRFVARGGRVSAYIDGRLTYDSGNAAQAGRRVVEHSPDFRTRYRVLEGGGDTPAYDLPAGKFAEPHIAVREGVAEFEYVKLYVPLE